MGADTMVIITASELEVYVSAIFQAAGAAEPVAARVAGALVESNLVGHDSHGVQRVPSYVDAIRAGTLKPMGEVQVVHDHGATALLDCGWTFGQVAAAQGMELAITKARTNGIGMAVLRHCDHTGRIGEYTVMAARQNMIGLVFCHGAEPPGIVAPFGGVGRAMGANPLAWGIPRGAAPIFLDFATAIAAVGKLQVAVDKGQEIPEGWLLDKSGQPSRNPRDIFDGGALMPFGGHKGYALSVMIELMCGGLSGVGYPLVPGYRWDQGTVLLAINIEAFLPIGNFMQMVDDWVVRLKQVPRADGVDEILLPGELEWRTRARRLLDGLPLPEATWDRITALADSLGVVTKMPG